MKVSIIIPVYNVSKYIARCLLSALNQTWNDIEIILINDCTPDDSMNIVRQVLEEHPRKDTVTILTHIRNRGLSAARNTGIVQATGDYLYFLDSDDYLPIDAIERLSRSAIEYDADMVVGDYEITGSYRWAPPLVLGTGLLIGKDAILSTYSQDKWYVMAWNKLIKRTLVIEQSLFFKEGLIHEDDLWSFMVACSTEKIYILHETTYFYYMQDHSIMRSPSHRNIECRVLIINYLFEYIDAFPSLKQNQYVYYLFETLKAKYFDRIIYFVKDKKFHYESYLSFRKNKYISPVRAFCRFKLGFVLNARNVHYLLPPKIGYGYFKSFVWLSYKFLMLSIKIDQLVKK